MRHSVSQRIPKLSKKQLTSFYKKHWTRYAYLSTYHILWIPNRQDECQKQSCHKHWSRKSELKATIEIRIDEIKYEPLKTINSLDMKIPTITPNKTSSSYEQPSTDIIKWALLKSPEKSSYASQFTKHMS